MHLFYSDRSGTLRDVIFTNQTNEWNPGTLGNKNWGLPAGRGVGLQAEWSLDALGKARHIGGGLRLFAGGLDGRIHEYAYDLLSGSWDEGFAFPNTNGYAGITSGQVGAATTIRIFNSNNKLELWYRDGGNDDVIYPSGIWTKGKCASQLKRLTKLRPPPTLGAIATVPILANSSTTDCLWDAYVYFFNPNNTISGIPFNGFREQEHWGTAISIPDAQPMPGTAISCWWFSSNNGQGGTGYMHFQTNGSNIAEYVGKYGIFSRAMDVPVG